MSEVSGKKLAKSSMIILNHVLNQETLSEDTKSLLEVASNDTILFINQVRSFST